MKKINDIRNTYKELKPENFVSKIKGKYILEIPIRNWNEPYAVKLLNFFSAY